MEPLFRTGTILFRSYRRQMKRETRTMTTGSLCFASSMCPILCKLNFLCTRPNHLKQYSFIFISVRATHKFLLICSSVILSFHLNPHIHLSIAYQPHFSNSLSCPKFNNPLYDGLKGYMLKESIEGEDR